MASEMSQQSVFLQAARWVFPRTALSTRYYLSKSWAGNLRRYVEAQARRRRSPSFSSSCISTSAGKGRRSRGRERAESNLMPPWGEVNADIVCQHGGLAHTSQGTRGKVRVGRAATWKLGVGLCLCSVSFRFCGVR